MKTGYPMWWDTTITLYNNYKDPTTQEEIWYRTVLTDCFWKNVGNQVMVGNETLEGESVICRIPADDNYVPKNEWDVLENKTGKFTISTNDIIVVGEVDDEINEYTSGVRSTDLLNKYNGMCMRISNMSINTYTGANNPHYAVRG